MPPDTLRRRKLTPPQLARLWGIGTDKILGWIRDGSIPAINAASRPGGRPRWLIDVDDLADFERSRAASPPRKATRRPAPAAEVIQFF
jgi:hypothetical protein